ncbi:transporter substrate-binding protein [Poseidonocella sedimentorum]|uniref:Amino acid/amide ABC transporter substrate-binding protein, HAAT family n=1 Tax=Poseidonocella sedimentorum TaxID=871652 RepID=A0A1I6D579_9RHOB|nr:transporter substrate-binding protein [Poseidonocella sedimentorum]SFR00442.1 amino acid/amide ABC transporter substrate-binding protein, HAAT family [Poseidonocella sedimentorum]
MTRTIDLGLLFSTTGPYHLMGQASLAGALKAIAQVNADPSLGIAFRAVVRDPGGDIDAYAPLCEEILKTSGARHVIGCTTSWSRKEVIPSLERMGGVLWYPTPYEGFEASDRVVYAHACPNQHLLPLLDHCFSAHGKRVYLTGSNYIWGWEMNRIAREASGGVGGDVLGERYVPIGSTDISRLVDEIAALKPDFVLNQLIGPSQYAFLEAMAELRARDAEFAEGRCPILSCNMTEAELPVIGAAAEGVISAGPWFRGLTPALPGNEGREDFGSSFEAAAHASVMMLARLLANAPEAETLPLPDLLALPGADAVGISARTHHVTLPVAIAQVRDGAFVPLRTYAPIEGDPYLTRSQMPEVRPLIKVAT